jgi:hypothetical protein
VIVDEIEDVGLGSMAIVFSFGLIMATITMGINIDLS